ncbi:hypothetical protein [Halobaculum magnesiiphilum]|uniref:Uncharacterized protein n=1 Tax=Halobaculum magnesiiphilum TaxID=1017351 RepID=A0A8T8W913_9EURY|nr:hypothetical protein [Halobaculum magnesiiphilum]QZP36311.1 hypothetical protein K6T50_08145 [Halobaculum magnesiiphilum]
MGLFDRDTDMSESDDDEGADAADGADGPTFEPIAGTADADGDGADGEGDADEGDVLSKLVGANFRDDDFNGTLKRAVDVEAGVVLYAYSNNTTNTGGLAAVPIDQTRLLDE